MDKSVMKRSKNFQHSEVQVLLDLVNHFKETIECKKTDFVSQREKDEVWKRIEILFNEKNIFVYRDVKTLKAKYENVKKVSKRTWADDKKYVMGTDGGPPKPVLTTTDVKVKEVLGPLQIDGQTSFYDSDSVEQNVKEGVIVETIEEEELGLSENLEGYFFIPNDHVYGSQLEESTPTATKVRLETKAPLRSEAKPSSEARSSSEAQSSSSKRSLEEEVNLSFNTKYTIQDLRKPTSSCLNTSKKRKSVFDTSVAGRKMEELSKSKMELVQLQRIVCAEQREIQRVEHELKVNCMKEEHKQKMRHNEEEHKEKINLLKLRIQKAQQEQ